MWARLKAKVTAQFTRLMVNYTPSVDKGTQILLGLKYRELANAGILLPFEEVEFRNFSQNGEDGILLYIFSLIGTTNKKVVEICAGNGVECNAANLIINHGWHGLLFDGDEINVRLGQDFYIRCRDTFLTAPTFIHAWIDRENVNAQLIRNDMQGEIDLLSIDMDGVDYWIWQAIDVINPRVVVLEYNELLGYESVTIRYDPNFRRTGKEPGYWGASLAAYSSLANRKGYRLIGCNRQRINAFFIRNDVGMNIFPTVPIASCMHRDTGEYPLLNELQIRYPFVHV